MKRVLLILAEGFEDVEGVAPIDILRRAGVEVTVAGLTPGLIRGARGTAVTPEVGLASVQSQKFDALVLPGGGKGAENLAASSIVKTILLRFQQEGKLIAAICAAPAIVLAPLGILDGKKATCFPGMEQRFPPSVTHVSTPVVQDGTLITAQSMGAALEFSLVVAEALVGESIAKKVRRDMFN